MVRNPRRMRGQADFRGEGKSRAVREICFASTILPTRTIAHDKLRPCT